MPSILVTLQSPIRNTQNRGGLVLVIADTLVTSLGSLFQVYAEETGSVSALADVDCWRPLRWGHTAGPDSRPNSLCF